MIELKPWGQTTSVYSKLKTTSKRIVVVQGGGQAGKTIAILQLLGDIAIEQPNAVISVFGMTYDHLSRGALRDFKNLIDTNPLFQICIENHDAKVGPFHFKNGSLIEFVALDKPVKALGAKRDYSFFNEANAISFEIYERIALRTTERIFLDYNPTARFWAHEKVLPFTDTAEGFIATFQHNEFCPKEAVMTLKGYFGKWKETGSPYWQNMWRVYGLGLTGIPEGVVFPQVNIIDKFPVKSDLSHFFYGVDWGFNPDPMVIIKGGILKSNGQFVGQELFYQTGIRGYQLDEIFPEFDIQKGEPIIADSANGDAISFLQKKGWNILPADKPPGSVKQGIELLNQVGINLVQGSENWIKEQAAYVWNIQNGVIVKDEPIDRSNHCWDAARYGVRWALLSRGVNQKKRLPGKRKYETY